MSYLDDNQIQNELNELFKGFSFDFRCVEFGGKLPIFFIKVQNVNEFKNGWERITEYIASNFQINLENEFETWNIYLFFLVDKVIDKGLKYRIENDTFSSRKIVIEKETDYTAILNEHVLNNNLIIDSKENVAEQGHKVEWNPDIWEALQGKTVKRKRRTADANEAFLEIKNTLQKPAK